jgi:hypothetical protein
MLLQIYCRKIQPKDDRSSRVGLSLQICGDRRASVPDLPCPCAFSVRGEPFRRGLTRSVGSTADLSVSGYLRKELKLLESSTELKDPKFL